jgi:carboxypeptidase C (cathepsin A)
MTGFSFQTNSTGEANVGKSIEYTQTSSQATEQAYQVLQQFLRVWPNLQQQPYFVQGLSYAGMYVPWMAFTVWQHNLAIARGASGTSSGTSSSTSSSISGQLLHVNLRGMAVGDPVMDNAYQYPTYAATLHGMGVVMEDERDALAAIFYNATRLQQVSIYI